MTIQPIHCFAFVRAIFQKYILLPPMEFEENTIRDALETVYKSYLFCVEDPDEELFIAALDAAFAVRGIILSDLIQHGEQ